MQIFSQLCCHISLDYPCNSTAPWECSPVSPEQLLLQLPTGSEGQCPVRHYAVGKFLPVHKSSQIHIEFGSPFLAQVLQTSKVQVSKTFKLSSYLFHRPIVTDASSAACSFSDCGWLAKPWFAKVCAADPGIGNNCENHARNWNKMIQHAFLVDQKNKFITRWKGKRDFRNKLPQWPSSGCRDPHPDGLFHAHMPCSLEIQFNKIQWLKSNRLLSRAYKFNYNKYDMA